MNTIDQHRDFIKDSLRKTIDFRNTDQHRGVPAPPIQKPAPPDAEIISLPGPGTWPEKVKSKSLFAAVSNRRSRRRFSKADISLEELAFLLWATQGIAHEQGKGTPALRTVPSAGARHSFETYLLVMNIKGLRKGLYRFLPLDFGLAFLSETEEMETKVSRACFDQKYAGSGAVTFVWTTIPYRMEWRYSLSAHRVILMDAGHVCQNLYLACEAVEAGTCAIGAYDQEKMDALIGIDGKEEFTVYLAPVGKI